MGGERTQSSLGRIGGYKPATRELDGIHYGIVEYVNENDPLVVDVRTFFGIVNRVVVANNPASKEGYTACPYKKGDGVILAFAGGNLNNPVIIGSLPERDRSQYEATFKTMRKRFMARAGNPNEEDYGESDITADVDCTIDEEGNVTLNIKGLTGNLTIITDGVTHINSSEIILGSDGEHKIPFGDELVKWLNSHTHVNGNAGSPTGTPIKPVLDKQVNSQQNRTD